MLEALRSRGILSLCRNLLIVALLYASIFGITQISRSSRSVRSTHRKIPSARPSAPLGAPEHVEVVHNATSNLQVKFAGTKKIAKINPHANVFNRPGSAVVPKDDYMGQRPHMDTVANVSLLRDTCRGSYVEEDRVQYVQDCLQFLAEHEDLYYTLPPEDERASKQSPKDAEFYNADGVGNTRHSYFSEEEARVPNNISVGRCPGPIIPYHTYWSGPATWRMELFVKSYLYTQNLRCSRLHIWLDADNDPKAVENMLQNDPKFAKLLPSVERGDVILESWRFPSRIPLPTNETHKGPHEKSRKPNSEAVGDGIYEDADGQRWLKISQGQMAFLPVALSDAVRFVILHQYGGIYLDLDVLTLRDMRPLLLGKEHNFAERWGAWPGAPKYNTAIMSLHANSSLSSYLLRGAVRMGLNFHPLVMGMMMAKDGRDEELVKLENGVFDPLWTAFDHQLLGNCTVPCFADFGLVFKGTANAAPNEWVSYEGEQLPMLDLNRTTERRESDEANGFDRTEMRKKRRRAEKKADLPPEQAHAEQAHAEQAHAEQAHAEQATAEQATAKQATVEHATTEQAIVEQATAEQAIVEQATAEQATARKHQQVLVASSDAFSVTEDEEAELRRLGIVKEYVFAKDKYPPNNRTLQNFYRGAFTHHIHNHWSAHPEPSSWLDVIMKAHDGFFQRRRTNAYGEMWEGPALQAHNVWPEFL